MNEKTLDNYIYISLIITSIILSVLFLIYNIFFPNVPFASCFIYETFGVYCPGCGCTRAFFALLNFDLINSLFHNSAVLYGFIILVLYLTTQTIDRVLKHSKYIMPYSNLYLYIGIFILIINCILKNLLAFAFNISI